MNYDDQLIYPHVFLLDTIIIDISMLAQSQCVIKIIFVCICTSLILCKSVKYSCSDQPQGDGDRMFGTRVAVSDSHVIVGSPDLAVQNTNGNTYIFEITSHDNLSLAETFSVSSSFDAFGNGVAVSDTQVAVSAPVIDNSQGAIYVYDIPSSGSKWSSGLKITASNRGASSNFGIDVHWYNQHMVTPAITDNVGAIHIFSISTSGSYDWSTATETKFLPTDPPFHFGNDIDICQTYIIAGSIYDETIGVESGAVYIWNFENNAWNFQQKITPFDGQAGNQFGLSVAINDAGYAIVGQTFHRDVYVYKYSTTANSWTYSTKIDYSRNAIGSSLSLSNDGYLIIGRDEDVPSGSNSGTPGTIFIYQLQSDDTWKLLVEQHGLGPSLGVDVAISNSSRYAVAGANGVGATAPFTRKICIFSDFLVNQSPTTVEMHILDESFCSLDCKL